MALTNTQIWEGVGLMLGIAAMFLAVPLLFLWTEGKGW